MTAEGRCLRDRRLLDACRRGDASAWRQVLDRYERLVYSIPLNYGLPREDAADICQLTFTALLQGLDAVRDDAGLGSWLATAARRQTWRVLDRSRREPRAPGEPPEPATEDDPIGDLDRIIWLHDGLQGLDPRCRELLLALYFDTAEPSYAEVADRLGRPVGSIGPTRARCLQRLRAELGDLD